MALAGLRETWRSLAGERVRSFTIVTTTPNELCAELHDRIPVVLNSAAMRGDRTRSLTRMEAPPRSCFVADSPLEGNGFELPVPGREAVNRDGRRTGCPEIGTDLLRNRRFESISLQQRVRCEPDLRTLPSMTVSSAGHVSMASIRLDAREQRRPSVMPSIGLVIAGRFVQGLGGGLLSALAYVLVRNVFGGSVAAGLWAVRRHERVSQVVH
jgi:hypothetical protein